MRLFAGKAKPFGASHSPCLSPLSGPVAHAQGEAFVLNCVVAVGGAALMLVCSNGMDSGIVCRYWRGGKSGRLLMAVRDLGLRCQSGG